MKIEPKQLSTFPVYISVIVNGVCNHDDRRYEPIDCGGLQYVNGELDWEEDYRPGEACNKCGSWRLEDAEWCGISDMPAGYAANSGKDIQDVTKLPF